MAKPKQPASNSEDFVFLNVPYDSIFAAPFLAYICGICAFGLIPRATLELQGGTRRLDRIVSLIESCRYSIHDMSRVELTSTMPRLLTDAAATDPFNARVFRDTVVFTTALAQAL
jgi:hypothetical protein